MRQARWAKILLGALLVVLALLLFALWRFTTWLDFEGVEDVTFQPIAQTEAPPAAAAPEELSRAAVGSTGGGNPGSSPAARWSGRLRGRCVDERHVALAGVRVSTRVDAAARSGERQTVAAVTDRAGEFALELPAAGRRRPLAYDLRFEQAARCRRSLRCSVVADTTVDLGDVVLGRGGAIRGIVLGPDRRPRAAQVMCTTWAKLAWPPAFFGANGTTLATAHSGADGGFELTGIPAGRVRVSAKAEDTGHGHSGVVEVREEMASEGLVLHLPAIDDAWTIRGRVVAADGAGVGRASLRLVGRHSWYPRQEHSVTLTADAEGRFTVEPMFWIEGIKLDWSKISVDITASDPVQRHDPVTVRGVWFGTQGVELRMAPPKRMIRITVRDQDGAPVERFELRRLPAGGPRGAHEAGSWVSPPDVHPGGEASIGASETPFRLRVVASGFAPTELGPFTAADAPDPVVVVLARPPAITGTVRGDGRPVAGALVRLLPAVPAEDAVEVDGFPCFADPRMTDLVTRTTAAGEFSLPLSAPRTGYLRVEHDDFAPMLHGPHTFKPQPAGIAVGVLELGQGGTLEGRVLASAPDAAERGNAFASVRSVWISLGDGHVQCAPVGRDGSYRFTHLTPGRWRVEVRDTMWDGSMRLQQTRRDGPPVDARATFPWSAEVRDGAVTRFDLRAEPPARLRGSLHVAGTACTDFSVRARNASEGAASVAEARVAADGRFELELTGGGPFRLDFAGELADGVALRLSGEVASAAADLRIDLPAGSLSGRVPAPPAERISRLEYVWEGVPGLTAGRGSLRFEARPDLGFTLATVPAGDGELVRWTTDPDGREVRSSLGKVQVRAGRATTLAPVDSLR